MPLGLSCAPGPGAYKDQHAAISAKAPVYSMSAKLEEFADCVPGPGSYNGAKQYSNMKYDKKPAYSLGAKGLSSPGNANPGPGTYKAKKVMGDAPHSVLTSRTPLAAASFQSAPGPGAYNVPRSDVTQTRAPKVSMGAVTKKGCKDTNPGPGTYKSPPMMGGGKKGFVFKQRPKEHSDRNPGPGAYHSRPNKPLGSGGPKYTMRVKTGVGSRASTPGPGAYNADKAYKGGLKKTFGSKGYEGGSSVPGPGTYNPARKNNTGKSFSRASRGGVQRAKTPGPGAYKVMRKSASTGGISLGSRTKTTYATGTPGVGAYNPKLQTKINRAPAYSMRSRSTKDEKGGTPGPGAYNCKPLRAPSKTMGSRLREFRDTTPGPGSYSQSYNSISMGVKKKKGKSMGQRYNGSDFTYASSTTMKSFTMKPPRPSTSA